LSNLGIQEETGNTRLPERRDVLLNFVLILIVVILAALVVLLNADFGTSAMGTWAVSGSDVTLSGTTCSSATVPFLS
jgi:phosphotransferase system  glucose/maltose/N-acetylglucosamine-specific IIC component